MRSSFGEGVLPCVLFYLFPLKFSISAHRLATGRKKFPGFRALAARGIRMGLRQRRGGLAMNEHELFAAAMEIDAPAERTGH